MLPAMNEPASRPSRLWRVIARELVNAPNGDKAAELRRELDIALKELGTTPGESIDWHDLQDSQSFSRSITAPGASSAADYRASYSEQTEGA